MSEPVLAGLTLLAWGIGVGGFIAVMKCCGCCRGAQCDAQAKLATKDKTGAQTDISTPG